MVDQTRRWTPYAVLGSAILVLAVLVPASGGDPAPDMAVCFPSRDYGLIDEAQFQFVGGLHGPVSEVEIFIEDASVGFASQICRRGRARIDP